MEHVSEQNIRPSSSTSTKTLSESTGALTSSCDDSGLLRQWKAGEVGAGNELVRRYIGEIGRYFRNKVCRAEDAADLVNQTFLACTTSFSTFRGETSFRRFLYAIASNVLHTYIRKQRKRCSEAVDFDLVCVSGLDTASPSSIQMHKREAHAFAIALRRLPLNDQILLEHRYFSGFDATEIGGILGIPAATVRGRLMRACERLRVGVQAVLDESQSVRRLPTTSEVSVDDLQTWAMEIRAVHGWV